MTRSLVEGLQRIGITVTYNPQRESDVAQTVIVLAGLPALAQAVRWRRSGRITRLLAGPNLVEFPSDARGLLTASEVDLCITPSAHTCERFVEDCPELAGRCVAWPAGVDTERWSPRPELRQPKRVLVYDKQDPGPVGPVSDYIPILESRGYEVSVLKYGTFMPDQYLALLRQSSFLVGFVAMESQGLAWSEAWSTGVPTLLWHQDRVTLRHPRAVGRSYRNSTAPYLVEQTGMIFRSLAEFPVILDNFEAKLDSFRPREWVISHLSDEACAAALYNLAFPEPERVEVEQSGNRIDELSRH